MTAKRSIKLMMAAGIPRDIARLWCGIGTSLCLTNEAIAAAAIHCEGKRPAEMWDMETVIEDRRDNLRVVVTGKPRLSATHRPDVSPATVSADAYNTMCV